MRWSSLVAILAATIGCKSPSETRSPQPEPDRPAERIDTMSTLPVVRTAADAKAHDGQRVQLVGYYRQQLTARKMGGPKSFEGWIDIELEGMRAEFDPKTAPTVKAKVQLGTDARPDDEIADLMDALVTVEGKLLLAPQPIAKDEGPRQRPSPILIEPGPVTRYTP
jgi:hypothetical protein